MMSLSWVPDTMGLLQRATLGARVSVLYFWKRTITSVARRLRRKCFQITTRNCRDIHIDDASREAWRSLVEEPLGIAIERYFQNDLVRGLVFTDAKIGVLTHPHDSSLLQNRCFIYHLIGNKTGEWKVPVGGMGAVVRELEQAAQQAGAEILTNVDLRTLGLPGKPRTVEFYKDGEQQTVEARYILVNFGPNVLARYT